MTAAGPAADGGGCGVVARGLAVMCDGVRCELVWRVVMRRACTVSVRRSQMCGMRFVWKCPGELGKGVGGSFLAKCTNENGR